MNKYLFEVKFFCYFDGIPVTVGKKQVQIESADKNTAFANAVLATGDTVEDYQTVEVSLIRCGDAFR